MTQPAADSLPRLRRRSNPLGARPGIAAAVLAAAVYAVLAYALASEPPAGLHPTVARLVALAPHLIAVINTAALICLRLGWRAIRSGNIAVHRTYMLSAATLISMFLVLYVTRVVLGGTKAFPGPAVVRTYLYLPMLAVHIVLSILSVPPVIYNVLVGLTRRPAEVGRTSHPRVGRVAVALWSLSLVLGVGVYLLLNIIY